MAKKGSSHSTPEASASQLLAELREVCREARELLADFKVTLKSVLAARELAEKVVTDITDGPLGEFFKEVVERETARYASSVQEATEVATEQIKDRITRLTAALMRVPPEILKDGVRISTGHEDPFNLSASPLAGRASPPPDNRKS